MKILLIGEYSNVHWTLAEGLRKLGHEVTVASNGDYWKDYSRDISIIRKGNNLLESIRYYISLQRTFSRLKGYDVVQLINPMFVELKAEMILPFYKKLRKNNHKVFLSAMGMDYYYVKACIENKIFDYSELVVDGKFRDIEDNRDAVRDWMNGYKGTLNQIIADDCDGIIAGLWEYYESYLPYFQDKLTFVPMPVKPRKSAERFIEEYDNKVQFFIGIQKSRNEFKGTDILLKILIRLESEFPDRCVVKKVENLPFKEYRRIMRDSDVLIDQLYSPTPNMNSLLAMSQGLVVAGGGEEVPYALIGESKLRPIINLPCKEDEIYETLKDIVLHAERIPQLKKDSIEYVNRHHTPEMVAERYLDFWKSH